jgi:hypothetical protein
MDGARFVKITFTVTDEGVGMSQEKQAQLFRNMVQIRPSTMQRGQGSSLGLTLCKALVDLHGGDIGVRSDEGRGSSFHVSINYALAETHHVAVANVALDSTASLLTAAPTNHYGSTPSRQGDKKAVAAPSAPSGRSPDMYALIVDDAPTIRMMLTALVGSLKVPADNAEDGLIALNAVKADLYKVINSWHTFPSHLVRLRPFSRPAHSNL